MGRVHLTYHLVAKITSFTMRDSKRMLQIFYMKNRKFTIKFFNCKLFFKYNKNISNARYRV
jgi:hypothetical protein